MHHDFATNFINELVVGFIEKRPSGDLAASVIGHSLQPSVRGVEPKIENVGKRRSRVAFRDPADEQPRIVGNELYVPIDSNTDTRLLACPEPILNRDMEPRPGRDPFLPTGWRSSRRGLRPYQFNGSTASVYWPTTNLTKGSMSGSWTRLQP